MFRRLVALIGITLTALFAIAAPLFAADAPKKSSGTVIEVDVEKNTMKVKDYDGKFYEIDKTYIDETDLKTGDVVEYEIIESKPTHVKRKK